MNVKIFKALGNSARLKIVQTLLVKEHNVTDLTSIIKKDQTTVSRHLLTLTNASIIKSKRNGRNIFYSIFNNQMKEWLLRILVSQTKSKKENTLRNKIEDYIMKQYILQRLSLNLLGTIATNSVLTKNRNALIHSFVSTATDL